MSRRGIRNQLLLNSFLLILLPLDFLWWRLLGQI